MRTTINLPDDLLAEAKRVAAATKRPLRAFIKDALRVALGRRRPAGRSAPVALTTYRGSRLQPRVDLDDSAALLD